MTNNETIYLTLLAIKYNENLLIEFLDLPIYLFTYFTLLLLFI